MEKVKQLTQRITTRANANLSVFEYDTGTFVNNAIEYDKLTKFYCFYGITSEHPIYFNFKHASTAGSYFLGKCYVNQSIIYKSDIRGDELKRKGDIADEKNPIPLLEDEIIVINGSLLYKTLVHSNSHNLETPEQFTIRNTVSAHHANIHGSTIEGCFLGAFATVDLMNLHSCIIGEFSYVQAGELFHRWIGPGVIYVESDDFNFNYRFDKKVIDKYIGVNKKFQPKGEIYKFVAERESEYERLFKVVDLPPVTAPETSAVNRYAVIKGDTQIGENVLVSQRAYLENALMGPGSNAQENTYIINSRLHGMNVTAHGGKIINADMGQKTFVGFNSFLSGKEDARLTVGKGCIVLPHTIIDIDRPLEIPDGQAVWGYISCEEDLKTNTVGIEDLRSIDGDVQMGNMKFSGRGDIFVDGFRNRIEHILELNGAYYDDEDEGTGHAQDDKQISFNTLQPYRDGENEGLYPSIRINP